MATHRPFGLATFLCTLQGKHTRSRNLVDTLQHAILDTWRTLTHAGVTPVSQTDLANLNVHRITIPRIRMFWQKIRRIAQNVFGIGQDGAGQHDDRPRERAHPTGKIAAGSFRRNSIPIALIHE